MRLRMARSRLFRRWGALFLRGAGQGGGVEGLHLGDELGKGEGADGVLRHPEEAEGGASGELRRDVAAMDLAEAAAEAVAEGGVPEAFRSEEGDFVLGLGVLRLAGQSEEGQGAAMEPRGGPTLAIPGKDGVEMTPPAHDASPWQTLGHGENQA